jgi:hypothetical protein
MERQHPGSPLTKMFKGLLSEAKFILPFVDSPFLSHSHHTVDLARRNVRFLGLLKEYLRGRLFSRDAEVEHEVWLWLQQQLMQF